jgi:stage V sporulation protein AF
VPYVEVDVSSDFNEISKNVLCGVFAIIIDGYSECVLIDSRTYPARNVSEPEKDKVLRGSKDGFVETLVFNTALIRRRIRSNDLRMEMLSAGESSKTDIAICYMESRVDTKFLAKIKDRINNIKVDALTLNQESLAECLYTQSWYNPFPKFKYTERPDTASAQILEGDIVILVDNSPSAIILPTSVLDMVQEADDFYFPPVTGSYLRITRFIILILTFFLTPTFMLLMQNPEWIPEPMKFITVQETINVPIILQFLILELSIDGLRLAAVNTPSMLTTPLSVTAGLVLGEFSVKSGWFNSEVMLAMAYIAIANYTHPSYELGYAIKFFRIITLILTAVFNLWGFILGVLLFIIAIATNKMISGQSYLYPLIPFSFKKLGNALVRKRLPNSKE